MQNIPHPNQSDAGARGGERKQHDAGDEAAEKHRAGSVSRPVTCPPGRSYDSIPTLDLGGPEQRASGRDPGNIHAIRHLVSGENYRKSFQETGDPQTRCAPITKDEQTVPLVMPDDLPTLWVVRSNATVVTAVYSVARVETLLPAFTYHDASAVRSHGHPGAAPIEWSSRVGSLGCK
eukprot:6177483-Pyramimonas_sp.AAC.1